MVIKHNGFIFNTKDITYFQTENDSISISLGRSSKYIENVNYKNLMKEWKIKRSDFIKIDDFFIKKHTIIGIDTLPGEAYEESRSGIYLKSGACLYFYRNLTDSELKTLENLVYENSRKWKFV